MSKITEDLFNVMQEVVSNGTPNTINAVVLEDKSTDTAFPEREVKKDEGFTLEEIEAFTKPQVEDVVETDKTDLLKEIKEKGTKKENEETDKPEGEETVDTDNAPNVYKAVSEIFKEEGFIDSEFDSAEKMVEVFSKRIEEEVNDYKDSLPEVLKELINNYEEGVPLEDLIKSKSEQIRYSNIDDDKLETNEDLQKEICKAYMKNTTRFSDEKINKEIKKLAEAGELFDESKANKKELVTLEKEAEKATILENKKRQEEAKANDIKVLKEIKKTVSAVKEIIPGVKISEKENEELFKMLTTSVEVVGNQYVTHAMKVREADPIKFDMTLNYLIKKGVFEGKWDSITTPATTKAVGKLEKDLQAAADKMTNKGGKSAPLPETDKSKTTLKGLEEALSMRKRAVDRD